MNIKYYALHDYDEIKKRKGAIEIKPEEALAYNKAGYGIYWTVNDYEGRRKIENITNLNYWFVDIDGGNKEEQLKLIENLITKPSMVIESKNGYHCYWQIENRCTIEEFKKIEKGLVKKLNGDIHCTDPVRLLRAPFFYHQKDKNNKFFIDVVFEYNKSYTTEKMIYIYGEKEQFKKIYKPLETSKEEFLNENNWERIFKISSIGKGNRNAMFARYIFWLKDIGLQNSAEFIINGLNRKLIEPLPQYEIDTLLKSKGC